MIEINLLPKDYRRGGSSLSLGKAGVYSMLGAAAIVVVLAAITFYQINQLSTLQANIEKANQRATLLRQDIRVVDGLMDVRARIQQRIEAVEQLDRHRSAWVRILEDISRNVPEFVWLVKFEEKELELPPVDTTAAEGAPSAPEPNWRPVEIEGYTFTLNALAAFMIKTMRSDYFDEVELVSSEDKKISGEKAYNFTLSANVHYLSDEELRNLIAGADKSSDVKSSHKSLN